MSSILIKGMEMPHDCDECKLCSFIPVGDYGLVRKCMPLNRKAEITIRRPDCPLVPVPPHGDLIDRETAKLYHSFLVDERTDIRVPAIPLSVLNVVPTVIPAEGG